MRNLTGLILYFIIFALSRADDNAVYNFNPAVETAFRTLSDAGHKGQVNVDVAYKNQAATLWCENASQLTGNISLCTKRISNTCSRMLLPIFTSSNHSYDGRAVEIDLTTRRFCCNIRERNAFDTLHTESNRRDAPRKGFF